MSLQDKLKLIIKEQGAQVLQNPELLAVLEDYQAFSSESPAAKAIMQQMVRSGAIKSLMATRKSGAGLQSEVRSVISRTADLGFKEDAVSDVLKAVVFASGKMSRENEWPKVLNPQKTPVDVSNKIAPPQRPVWKRFKTWIWTYSEELFVITLLITAILTVVTLFLTFAAFVNGTPKVGHWAKEFLICLSCTVVLFFAYVLFDDAEQSSAKRKTQSKLIEKDNFSVIVWCVLMLFCTAIFVTGLWKLFSGTISYGGACWMIFPPIILGGLLWIFNEAL